MHLQCLSAGGVSGTKSSASVHRGAGLAPRNSSVPPAWRLSMTVEDDGAKCASGTQANLIAALIERLSP